MNWCEIYEERVCALHDVWQDARDIDRERTVHSVMARVHASASPMWHD